MKIIHNMDYIDLKKDLEQTFTEFIGEVYIPFKPLTYKFI